jgi:hypothetical protein
MTFGGKITLVLLLLAICATAALVHCHDRPEAVNPAELFNAVRGQLAACQDQDFPTAYRQVSSKFQQQWPMERFAAMVRNDYARTLKPGRVEFGSLKTQDSRAVVEIYFIDRTGAVTPCLYTLVSEGGAWKIDSTRWGKTSARPLRGIRS